jgi:hypothetical protein
MYVVVKYATSHLAILLSLIIWLLFFFSLSLLWVRLSVCIWDEQRRRSAKTCSGDEEDSTAEHNASGLLTSYSRASRYILRYKWGWEILITETFSDSFNEWPLTKSKSEKAKRTQTGGYYACKTRIWTQTCCYYKCRASTVSKLV